MNLQNNGKLHTLKNRKNKGFTLVELMLVIAVALILIGIGLVVYRQVTGSSGALSGSTGLMQISSGVKQLYPAPNYTGVDAPTLVKTGKAPSNMVSGTALVNNWGGAVTLAASNYSGGTNNAFTVTFTNVPTDACNSLAASVQNNFQIISIGAGAGTAVKDDSAGTVYSTANVATACAASNTNTMNFTTT